MPLGIASITSIFENGANKQRLGSTQQIGSMTYNQLSMPFKKTTNVCIRIFRVIYFIYIN